MRVAADLHIAIERKNIVSLRDDVTRKGIMTQTKGERQHYPPRVRPHVTAKNLDCLLRVSASDSVRTKINGRSEVS